MDLSDPWVVAALTGKLDREAYAAHLGDSPQGELLRLLIADRPDPRIDELREVVPAWWVKLFGPPSWILGCRAREAPLQMAVECDQAWGQLAHTGQALVRHCAKCGTDVYQVRTRKDAENHARAGHCIAAIDEAARAIHASVGDTRGVVGRPHAPSYWAKQLIGS